RVPRVRWVRVRGCVDDRRSGRGHLPAEREPLLDRRGAVVARRDDVGVQVDEAAHGSDATGAYTPRRAGSAAHVVRGERPRPPLAADARPVRDPRLGGDAPADAGLACRPALPRMARALADRGRARRRLDSRGDPGLAGARLQPPRGQPAARGPARGGARLARRPHGSSRRRPVHRRRPRELRLRPPSPSGRRQRRPRARAHRRPLRPQSRSGALRPRGYDLSRAPTTVPGLPARRPVPIGRPYLRAAAQARPVRGLVPAAARRASSARHASTSTRRRGPRGRRLAPRGRARCGRGRSRYAARVTTRYDELIAKLRRAAQPDRPAPPQLAAYLDQVRSRAYTVTDVDVQALKDAGFSDDEIFEQTVSAAVAAGLHRLDKGLECL